MDNKLVTGLAVVAIVLSGLAFFGAGDGDRGPQGPRGDRGVVGGASGPVKTDTQYFYSNFTVGNTAFATSSGEDASVTLSNIELDIDLPYVSYTANVNQTLTIQASTTAPFSGMRPGESFSTVFYSATTTAAATITFAEGTGIDFQVPDGGNAILNGQDVAKFTFVKKSDTDVLVIFDEYFEL